METQVLAKIWNKLNYYEWPDELKGKPERWDKSTNKEKRNMIPHVIVDNIYKKIGEYPISEWRFLNQLGLTKEEHDEYIKESIENGYLVEKDGLLYAEWKSI